MKIKLLRNFSAAWLSCLVLLTGCEKQKKLDGDGDEGTHALLVHLTEDQWNAIQPVLNETPPPETAPREALFRIRKYTEGDGGHISGQMSNDFLLRGLPDKEQQFTGYAVQIGLGVKKADEDYEEYPAPSATATEPTTNTGQAHFRNNLKESQRMVKEVKCILISPTCTPTPTPTETATPTPSVSP
jgi:hypothetical protein